MNTHPSERCCGTSLYETEESNCYLGISSDFLSLFLWPNGHVDGGFRYFLPPSTFVPANASHADFSIKIYENWSPYSGGPNISPKLGRNQNFRLQRIAGMWDDKSFSFCNPSSVFGWGRWGICAIIKRSAGIVERCTDKDNWPMCIANRSTRTPYLLIVLQ
jgi:hypothetical protein